MCKTPIQIVNQAKHLHGGSPFFISVPCGKCFSCQQRKSLEYELRAYYEFKDCIQTGGFVYTDCLTYADEYLPRLRDYVDYIPVGKLNYPCFSYPQFRLFMVRLRKYLERLGYCVKDKLRYFMASEYGTSEGCTHRPHYHIIFYSNVHGLDNITLSKAVSSCWPYGRTDGLPFKTLSYINKHTYTYGITDFHIFNCVGYISKYVAKQSYYNSLVYKRLASLACYFRYDKGTKEFKKLISDVRKYSFQFHRQSLGFGLSALKDIRNSVENIMRTGCLVYKSTKSTMLNVPLPQYFARKLFYEVTRSIDGSLHWYLNNDGISFRQQHIDKCIQIYADKLTAFFHMNPDSHIDELLSGRSWHDFATYVLLYKGRIKSDEQILRESKGIYKADDPYTMHTLSLMPFLDSVYYNYNTSVTKSRYGCGFISGVDIEKTSMYLKLRYGKLDSQQYNISTTLSLLHNIYPSYDVSKLMLNNVPFCFTNKSFLAYVINENSDSAFRDFDVLFTYVARKFAESSALQQGAFDLIQKLTSQFKEKGFL